MVDFLPSERGRDFLSPIFYRLAPKCFFSRCLVSASRSDFMTVSLVLSIDVPRILIKVGSSQWELLYLAPAPARTGVLYTLRGAQLKST